MIPFAFKGMFRILQCQIDKDIKEGSWHGLLPRLRETGTPRRNGRCSPIFRHEIDRLQITKPLTLAIHLSLGHRTKTH